MTYNTRIQLKSDTETNWIAAGTRGFIPLAGEMIIYSADATHDYCRLKIGDGSTNVTALHFIDSGTINGEEVEIVKATTSSDFPAVGSSDKLYVDLTNNRIYHYGSNGQYAPLSNFSLNVSTTTVSKITQWSAGVVPEISIENNVLILKNGLLPELTHFPAQVVSNVTKG